MRAATTHFQHPPTGHALTVLPHNRITHVPLGTNPSSQCMFGQCVCCCVGVEFNLLLLCPQSIFVFLNPFKLFWICNFALCLGPHVFVISGFGFVVNSA